MAIPIMGPRMTALGEIDFMSAQMSAARQIRPRSGLARWPAVITSTPKAAEQAAGEWDAQIVQEAADDDLGRRPQTAVHGRARPGARLAGSRGRDGSEATAGRIAPNLSRLAGGQATIFAWPAAICD